MKKILIIEDDSAIAEIEKDYLTLSGLDAASAVVAEAVNDYNAVK